MDYARISEITDIPSWLSRNASSEDPEQLPSQRPPPISGTDSVP